MDTAGGGKGRWDKLGDWDRPAYTTVSITEGKRLYSTGGSDLCSVMTQMSAMGVGRWEGGPRGGDACRHVKNSLHCASATNTTL